MNFNEQRMRFHKRCAAAFAAASVVLGIGSYHAFDNVEANKKSSETIVDVVEGEAIRRTERQHTFESGALLTGGIVGAAGSLTTAVFGLVSGLRYRRRANGGRTYHEMRAEAEALNQPHPEPRSQG